MQDARGAWSKARLWHATGDVPGRAAQGRGGGAPVGVSDHEALPDGHQLCGRGRTGSRLRMARIR